MNRQLKTVLFWVVFAVAATLLWQVVRSTPQDRQTPEISYSQFMSDIEADRIASVTIDGTMIQGAYREGKGSFRLTGPNPSIYLDSLHKNGVEIRFRDGSTNSTPGQLLGTWAPLILLGALWFFMIRQMQRRRTPPPPGTGSSPIEPK